MANLYLPSGAPVDWFHWVDGYLVRATTTYPIGTPNPALVPEARVTITMVPDSGTGQHYDGEHIPVSSVTIHGTALGAQGTHWVVEWDDPGPLGPQAWNQSQRNLSPPPPPSPPPRGIAHLTQRSGRPKPPPNSYGWDEYWDD